MRVSGVVLAGGPGSRLGAYKPLVPIGGRPLVTRALDALAPLAGEILLMHGRAENALRLEAVRGRAALVPDPGIGPLGALRAAAGRARGEWLLVTASDVPWRDAEALRALLAAAEGREGAVFELDGSWDPVVAAYRRSALEEAAEVALAGGERSARRALARLDLARVPAPADLPGDIDTPADLARAHARSLR